MLTWVEIDKNKLSSNIKNLKSKLKANTLLCPCIKSNAYGHGLLETGKIFLESSADWLSVNSIYEAKLLREAEIDAPIYILGYVGIDELEELLQLKSMRIVVYNYETIEEIYKLKCKNPSLILPKLHIKIETGNNRQGVHIKNLLDFANFVLKKGLEIEGVSTHFANIEDTTDHSYARLQFEKFQNAIDLLKKNSVYPKYTHCANSAATILFEDTKLNMVRPGISTYGMWPSEETKLSVSENDSKIKLSPAFTWKSKIAQVKNISNGEYIGYGCTYQTKKESKIAIIPVGYYDGYDRGVKDAYVLIRGKHAPVRGRVCMNIIMVDITDIPEARLEDEVVLIGQQGEKEISAELFASWASTINYEVTTRVNDRIARIYV